MGDLNGASVVWTAFLREVDRASLSAMHDDTDGEDGRRMRDPLSRIIEWGFS